jgi:hypothetical protein
MTQDKQKPPSPPKKKTTAEVLKEALAAKKAGVGKGGQKLRPDMGKGVGGNKDAERLKGLSRKVH